MTTDAELRIRLATLADVEAVIATVAAAFANDSAWSFITDDGDRGVRAAFAKALLIPRVRRGTAWVVDDCSAVAMWDRIDVDAPSDPEDDATWAAFRAEAGEEVWTRLHAYDGALEADGPAAPYWYLGVLATHPDAHGRGLATAVMQPGLRAAQAEGWDCWLETSTPSNKRFYAGRGFTEPIEVDIPGGPPTWWLRRPHLAS